MSVRGSIQTLAVRLSPGADVRREIIAIAKREKVNAGFVMGAVGSLSATCLRFANQKQHTMLTGKFEVLTLSGTLAQAGVHLHMTVANSEGQCFGGHVVDGCAVYTTLELVLGVFPEVRFDRTFDPETGFKELDIQPNQTFDH